MTTPEPRRYWVLDDELRDQQLALTAREAEPECEVVCVVQASSYDALQAERDALAARVTKLELREKQAGEILNTDTAKLQSRLTTADGLLRRAFRYVDDDSTDLPEQIRAFLAQHDTKG